MIRISQFKLEVPHNEKQFVSKIAKQLRISESEILSYEIQKLSIDARKKPQIYYIYVVDVKVNNAYHLPFRDEEDICQHLHQTSFYNSHMNVHPKTALPPHRDNFS